MLRCGSLLSVHSLVRVSPNLPEQSQSKVNMLSESFSWLHLCSFVSAVLSTLVVLSALTVKGTSAATTGCPKCGMPAMEKGAEERYLVEIAKQQILNKLHLRERPNITQTVPRAALMTALRKLHAGRLRQDGTLELDNNLPNSRTSNQAYEIVSFADVGEYRNVLKTFIENWNPEVLRSYHHHQTLFQKP